MTNTEKINILMLAFFFSARDGVGSQRSHSLYSFLRKNGFSVYCINKNTWKNKNQFLWGILSACYIIKNRSLYEKIYISCGPYIPLLFVSLAAKIVNKAVIVDFRDPWSLNIASNYGSIYQELIIKQRIKANISRLIEKTAYKMCQHFIVCTEGMKADYERLFNDNKKLRLITNGYDFDSNEFRNMSPQVDEIRFVCLGKFAEYDKEKAKYILTEIKKYGASKKRRIKLIFIGSNRNENEPLINQYELSADWYPRLPYQEALNIAVTAHFGLCLIRNEYYDYGTKVFDYIGLGLPIFNYFKEDNNFVRCFREYLSTEPIRIPNDRRLPFNRERIFINNIDIFT